MGLFISIFYYLYIGLIFNAIFLHLHMSLSLSLVLVSYIITTQFIPGSCQHWTKERNRKLRQGREQMVAENALELKQSWRQFNQLQQQIPVMAPLWFMMLCPNVGETSGSLLYQKVHWSGQRIPSDGSVCIESEGMSKCHSISLRARGTRTVKNCL